MSLLDSMAVHMLDAANERHINTTIIEVDTIKHLTRQLTHIKQWLNFNINGQEFCYGGGALLKRDTFKGEKLWHNLNHQAALICANKFQTKLHLEKNDFSVPKGFFFRRRKIQDAYNSFYKFDKPICVKPNNGLLGKNVFTEIINEDHFKFAIDKVAENYPNIVVEESAEGQHFRFFYVYPSVVGVRCGIRMHVTGDNFSTISELIEKKNKERIRKNILSTHPIFDVNEEVLQKLKSQNIHLNDIPKLGETVLLASASNYTAGAESILYDPKEVHQSYLEIVAKACQSIPGLFFSGVDLIIKDLSTPATKDNHWFLELNTIPATGAFYFPWKGIPVDVAGCILDMLKEVAPFE